MTERPDQPDDAPTRHSQPDGYPVTGLPPSTTAPATDYTDAGVPTLNYLQDRIDRRHGTALGATELAEAGEEAQAQQRTTEDREKAAHDRLEEIRRSLRSQG